MRIAVVGATQGIGRALVAQARALGWSVAAVARSIEARPSPGFDPIRGSILDEGVAEAALAGTDAVALCLGSRAYGPDVGRPVTVFSEATRRVLDVAAARGVERILAVTGVGSGGSGAQAGLLARALAMPLALGAIYADKSRQEEMLRASDHAWTILRPTILTNGPYTGTWVALDGDARLPSSVVSRADCADACVRAIAEGLWIRRAATITGGGAR